jgi:hypothetical protein
VHAIRPIPLEVPERVSLARGIVRVVAPDLREGLGDMPIGRACALLLLLLLASATGLRDTRLDGVALGGEIILGGADRLVATPDRSQQGDRQRHASELHGCPPH